MKGGSNCSDNSTGPSGPLGIQGIKNLSDKDCSSSENSFLKLNLNLKIQILNFLIIKKLELSYILMIK